jgi:hypothetical protein
VWGGRAGATAAAVILLLSQIATGIPKWWGRLPGTFRIEGFAAGIDAIGTSRAEWAATNLQPGSRYFGDFTSASLLATLAQLDPIHNPGSLYDTDHLTPEDSALIKEQSATYVDVDTRMAEQAPITGGFFPQDPKFGEREMPIDPVNLAKFDRMAGMSRIYDSGYDFFYDLRGVQGSRYGN